MGDDHPSLIRREIHAARRLARLFGLERGGRVRRWPPAAAQRLAERRGRLIDELIELEARRRSFEPWTPTELDLAMGRLRREIERSEQTCRALLAELGAELAGRGEAPPSGVRGDAAGRLLGRG
ncbi:MAG: hypothetical protein JO032_02065 [Alphaproteobacteria bacterium]|nr:hypothetical protein [Alphaproteobacteria bacterium]MBV9551555.1 hypothetical protein [Alphaproteobacteria bacterium]